MNLIVEEAEFLESTCWKTKSREDMKIRRSEERGHFRNEWLDSKHSFSFSSYYDPNFMGFRSLRVINEDRIQPRNGFPMHSHRDMEIITYVLSGALEHKDNMDNVSVLKAGQVQKMSAGKGVMHSEYNHSEQEELHLLQIWILPEESKHGIEPEYREMNFPKGSKHDNWCLIAAPEGRDGAIEIHQDAELYALSGSQGKKISYQRKQERHLWLQVAKGEVVANGQLLKQGDAAALGPQEEKSFELEVQEVSELLLFDLA